MIKFLRANKFYSFAVLLTAAILSYFFFVKGNGGPDYEIYMVGYGDVYREISETGIVRPSQSTKLGFEIQGKVEEIKIKAGDKVTAGQALVVLARDELFLQVSQAQAALETARARLDKVLAGASAEDVQVYETAVINAEVTLQNKKQALADAVADAESGLEQAQELMPVELRDAYADCDDAVRNKADQLFTNPRGGEPRLKFTPSEAGLKNEIEWQRFLVEDILSRWKILLESISIEDDLLSASAIVEQHLADVKDFLDKVALAVNSLTVGADLSQTTIDTWKAAVATARTNVAAALSAVVSQKQAISTVKITNQTAVNTARAAVDTAEASLKTARDNLALKKAAPREADLALAEAEVRQAEASLALKREKLNQGVLRSPINGIVTSISIEEGEIAAVNAGVVSVDGEGEFQIKADIYEEDIPWIKVGDLVNIEIVAFPDEILEGRISSVNPAEKLVNGVVYYEVEISFDVEKEGLKNGMTTDIVIKTDERENVLVIPRKAVLKRNGRQTVEIISGGMIEEREIKTGIEGTDAGIEIVSGLSEGEEIILR